MKHKGYERIGEQIYEEKLPNGLSVFVIPKRGFNKSYAFFATKYGGADRRFKLAGRWTDTPEGVAHFLEHKMFDTEDGNALANLSANGASPNAFTSADITAYYFESTEKFEENLNLLLSFVSVPYFTDESVEKEQGIIGQEIRMTEDDPEFALYYGLMKSLYKNNPIRDSVAGTVESISEITAQTLYDCHRIFYNPSNMALCVTGDVSPERIASIAFDVLPKEAGETPEIDYGEPESLFPEKMRSEAAMEVSLPIFSAGSKVFSENSGREKFRRELIGDLAMQIMAGKSSPLFLRLYGEGLINNQFSADFESAAGAAYIMFGGESRDPDAVFEEIKKEASRVANSGADKALFDRVKKTATGKYIRSLNSFDRLCYNYVQGYLGNYDFFEAPEILSAISLDDVSSFIAESITPEKMAISVINPRF